MKNKFKIGDRVIVTPICTCDVCLEIKGQIAKIIKITDSDKNFKLDIGGGLPWDESFVTKYNIWEDITI